jgi:probable F420-dependent oxidoreductase
MRIGLHALGIGSGAQPDIITAVSRAAEQAGFATLWAGEHVIMVDQPASRYPYTPDGQIAVPSTADWLDPLLTLTHAAAATSQIRLATGILLLPEHHPLIIAKQAATLDLLSGGRLTLGVGLGWSAEEYAALDIPFASRADRAVEYIAALRTLWAHDPATFHGQFVNFTAVRSNPKPVRDRAVPIVLGGNTNRALGRVAAVADGWYGFNVPLAQVADRVRTLEDAAQVGGRDPDSLSIAVAVPDASPDDLASLGAFGVDELVLVESPPSAAADASAWVRALAERWITAAAASA